MYSYFLLFAGYVHRLAYDKETVLRSTYLKEVATAETMGMIEKYGLRNAELLSIAPTGSISTMFGVSGGLEPLFNIAYTRESKTLHNEPTFYKVFTPIAKEYMDKHNITKEEDLPDFFVTSSTLDYRARIDMQSVWQKYIDAAISSTVNVPNNFTVEEVEDITGTHYEYTIQVKPIEGAASTLSMKIPKVDDEGNFKINGVNYRMRMQRGD